MTETAQAPVIRTSQGYELTDTSLQLSSTSSSTSTRAQPQTTTTTTPAVIVRQAPPPSALLEAYHGGTSRSPAVPQPPQQPQQQQQQQQQAIAAAAACSSATGGPAAPGPKRRGRRGRVFADIASTQRIVELERQLREEIERHTVLQRTFREKVGPTAPEPSAEPTPEEQRSLAVHIQAVEQAREHAREKQLPIGTFLPPGVALEHFQAALQVQQLVQARTQVSALQARILPSPAALARSLAEGTEPISPAPPEIETDYDDQGVDLDLEKEIRGDEEEEEEPSKKKKKTRRVSKKKTKRQSPRKTKKKKKKTATSRKHEKDEEEEGEGEEGGGEEEQEEEEDQRCEIIELIEQDHPAAKLILQFLGGSRADQLHLGMTCKSAMAFVKRFWTMTATSFFAPLSSAPSSTVLAPSMPPSLINSGPLGCLSSPLMGPGETMLGGLPPSFFEPLDPR